jgi:hypothetical protein
MVGLGAHDCGERTGYQIQSMASLDLNTQYALLTDEADPEESPDPALATLAAQINAHFAPKAKIALQNKRASLVAAGHADAAARTEITVLLTSRGLQLGWSVARDWKQLAPAPTKSLVRRLLGPLFPGRRYRKTRATDDEPVSEHAVRWPWIVWAIVALALGYLGWSLAVDSFTPWSAAAAG